MNECAYCERIMAFPFVAFERNGKYYCSLGCFEMAGMAEATGTTGTAKTTEIVGTTKTVVAEDSFAQPAEVRRYKLTRIAITERWDGNWEADVTIGITVLPNTVPRIREYTASGATPNQALASLKNRVAEKEDGWTWMEAGLAV